MTRKTMLAIAAAVLAVAVVWAGCEDEIVTGPPGVRPGIPPAAAAGAADGGVGPGQPLDAGVGYRDEDFVEGDTNRDPFRSFAKMFKIRPPEAPQRRVLLGTTSIEEMRLIAIVTGVTTPRAMLVDPAGVGHVVERGDYLGRAEVVNAGGSEDMPVTLNWRVDRIRPGEVVLTREDPTTPNRAPLTRVIVLDPNAVPGEQISN